MTQLLKSFFASSQELRQITGKLQQLRAMQQNYEQVVPLSLQRSSFVLQMEQGILILAANNGAIAAKLRQMTPEITAQFRLLGCEVTGIQVRVQVTLPPNIQATPPATVSVQGKRHLNNLADSLNESPLKSAIRRLAQNNKRRP